MKNFVCDCMETRPGRSRAGAAMVLFALALAWAVQAPAARAEGTEAFTIAVVRDGPPSGPDSDLAALVEAELPRHLPEYLVALFKHDPAFDAGWQLNRAPAALEAALADPEVDMILVSGAMVTRAAADEGRALDKPVVSGYVQRADIFHLPQTDDDRSAKTNFVFIDMPSQVSKDVKVFRSLIPFQRLHLLAGETDLAVAGDIADEVRALEQDLEVLLITVPATTDIEAVSAGLGDQVEAVYLTTLPRISPARRKTLIDGLNQRGLPTFSLIGHADVQLGVLAGLSPDLTRQTVRRTALNLSRLIRGEAATDLPVQLPVDTRLLINARTAMDVGYAPDPETRLYASFIHEEAFESDAEELGLVEAMQMAETGSTSLSVEESRLESVRAGEKIARSPLLPQAQADLAHAQTDGLFSLTSAGLATDGATMGRASVRQMIYDDKAVSDWRAAKRLTEAGSEAYETARLDIRTAAGETFLSLALARALYQVRMENIRLTRENLDLANLRRDVGFSGRDEIYRWEAQLADQRSQLLRSAQEVDTAMIALNQILGTAQYRRWRPREIVVDEDSFQFAEGVVDDLFRDPAGSRMLREVLVDVAVERSPEVRALARNIEAQEIDLNQLGRSYFLPSFFLDLSYTSELIAGDDNIFAGGGDSYGLMVGATYPFLQGGLKVSRRAKGKADLEALERQLALARELVEQRTRTAMNRVSRSFARIGLSREAAEVAAKNLELVQDKYAEGVVNVTDLDSAQSQLFVAEQAATVARYEFLLDLVALQRSLSMFKDELEPGEAETFLEEVEEAVAARMDEQGQ